jgi:DNA-binding transcriptional LysR family regulator
VGVTDTAPFHPFVPRTICTFREAFPLVSLALEQNLSLELIEQIRNELIDVAFLRTPIVDPAGLAIAPLLEEPMVVALASGHVLARRDGDSALTVKSLAGEKFIIPGPAGTGLHDATIAACHAAGFSPQVGQQTPRITSTMGLVAAGLGVAFVPASLKRVNMAGVAYRPLKGPAQPKAILNLASRRGDPSAVVRQFVNLVRKGAKNYRDA